MAVNFGGGETSSFATFNSIETTLSGSFKAPARCGIHTKKGGRIKASFSATSSQWFHLDMHVGLINSTLSPIVISDLSNSPLFTLMSSGSVKLGSTVVGSAPIVVAGLCTIDIHLVHGSSGLVEIFVNSQPVFSSTGDYNFSNMAYLTLSPIGTNSTDVTDTVWSQVIISDEITISNELATLVFTALGDLTDWGGQV